MIDLKKLDEMEDRGTGAAQIFFPAELMLDLIDLARLGLWAEEHAIPALKYSGDGTERNPNIYICISNSMDALAALPKSKKDGAKE